MNTQKNSSFLKRLSYSFRGLVGALQREASFRIQSVMACSLILFCLFLRPPLIWCAAFVLSATLVLALEAVNTAFEAALDRLHPEQHPEIGFAKDCLAGAVLLASIGAVLVFICYVFQVCGAS